MAERSNRPAGSSTLAPRSVFGRYAIERVLASGGMGTVYVATHVDLKKRVALKTLLPALATHPEARARFLREGELAAKLHHPHVVDVTDLGIENGIPFLVMEYLEGEDLASTLEREGRLFPDALADLLIPVIAALAMAHDEDIVHRDLKPQNIFLTRTRAGQVAAKLLDFGISKALNDREGAQLTGAMAVLGTPSYMSPEQIKSGRNVDARTDQYAMGVILYQASTGKLPFTGETIFDLMSQITSGSYPSPGEVCPGLPVEFETLITTAMSADRERRFATTRAFGAALMPFANERVRLNWQTEFEDAQATDLHLRAFVDPVPELRQPTGPPPLVDALLDGGPSATEPIAVGRSSGVSDPPPSLPQRSMSLPEVRQTDRVVAVRAGTGARRALSPGRPPETTDPHDLTPHSEQLPEAYRTANPVAERRTDRVDTIGSARPREDSVPTSEVQPTRSLPWPLLGAGAGVLVVAGLALALFSGSHTATPPTGVVVTVPSASTAPVPSGDTHGTGRLVVTGLLHGQSASAMVTIDGQGQPRPTPLEIDLPLGSHHLEVTRQGVAPVQMDVVLHAGPPTVIRLELTH